MNITEFAILMSSLQFGLLFALSLVLWRTKVDSNDLLRDMFHRHESAELKWDTERQKLLDRIQAPSFDHLKQAEIRLTKVQNNEKEPPKLEQL